MHNSHPSPTVAKRLHFDFFKLYSDPFFPSLHFCLFPAKLTPELPYKVLCSGKESSQDSTQSGTLAVTAAHTPPCPNPIFCFPANVQLRSRSQVKIQPLWNVYKMRYHLQTAIGSHTKKQRPSGRGQGWGGWGVWGDPDRAAGNSLQVSSAIDVASLFIWSQWLP